MEDDLNDPAACSWAMKPEVDWYKDQVDSYFISAKDSGQVRGTVKRMIQPFAMLVSNSL